MKNTIGDGAIKIACIQTLPGHEFAVKEQLEIACNSMPEISNHLFLKGLGSFDIVLLYATNGYGSLLRKIGPIKGIVRSNILLCYPYMGSDSSTIIDTLSKKTFTSFSLLKISPGLKDSYPKSDELLRNFVSKQGVSKQKEKKWHLLGSLGWNELIVLISSNNLHEIMDDTFSFGQIGFTDGSSTVSVILKSLSFLGISYKFIPIKSDIEKGFKHTKSFFKKIPDIENVKLNTENPKLLPTITVTIRPSATISAKDFFKNKGFHSIDITGKRDIIFIPTKEISLGDFLSTLLIFRFDFSNKLFETNTTIGFSDSNQFQDDERNEIDTQLEPFHFEYKKLVEIFDKELAPTFSSLFFTLNSFFQNPLCGQTFKDMHRYPQYIMEVGEQLKTRQNHLHFAQGAREVLKLGAELRSYGTFDTLEEVAGKFSEFRGGAQLSLQAIEFFPSYVLDNAKIKWMGFVVTGDPKFYHINEVINVPTETLWMPDHWWAIFHEIAHIIIDNTPEILSRNLPEVRQFLSNKSLNESYSWISTLTEFTAEVIGFELVFFGDFKKFLEVVWGHLINIDRYQNQHVSLESYAMRTFFVQLFIGHFRRSSHVDYVTKKQFTEDLDYLYEKIIEHMDLIESITNTNLFKKKEFSAANNAKLFTEIYPYACNLNKQIIKHKLKVDKRALKTKNTLEVTKQLVNGKLWPSEVASPEAIIYNLINMKKISFKTRIATILTFWNQQMIKNRGPL